MILSLRPSHKAAGVNYSSAFFSRISLCVALFLFASLCFGVAQNLFLPPFEGFDETAHFSYIKEIADTGRWPPRGEGLSDFISAYETLAPSRYASIPPYDENGRITYQLFADTPTMWGDAEAFVNRPLSTAKNDTFSGPANWQAQHPPLYYFLLASLYKVSESLPFIVQLCILRIASYTLAWSSIVILSSYYILQIRRSEKSAASSYVWAAFGAAIWPFVIPGWFTEMSRIGNDSLVVLFAVLTWLMLLWYVRVPTATKSALLGMLLGFGLLTKATFIPLAVTLVGAALVQVFTSDVLRRDRPKRIVHLSILIGVMIVISAPWYVSKWLETGNVIGSVDLSNASAHGGIFTGLRRPNFFSTYLYGWASIVSSFVWSGTWSFVKLPSALLAPYVLICTGIVAAHLWLLRQKCMTMWDYFPMCVLIVFLFGLGYHLINFIAAYGVAGTPGWYVHSMLPFLAWITGTGLSVISGRKAFLLVLATFLLYSVFYLVASLALGALMASGCPLRSATVTEYGSALACAMKLRFFVPAGLSSPLAGVAVCIPAAFSFGFGLFALGKLFDPTPFYLRIRPYSSVFHSPCEREPARL